MKTVRPANALERQKEIALRARIFEWLNKQNESTKIDKKKLFNIIKNKRFNLNVFID